jgi:hypothetical protein
MSKADAVNLANEGVKIVAAARRANEGEETGHLKLKLFLRLVPINCGMKQFEGSIWIVNFIIATCFK